LEGVIPILRLSTTVASHSRIGFGGLYIFRQLSSSHQTERWFNSDRSIRSLSKAADDYLSSDKLVSFSPEQLYQEVVLGKNTQYFLVDIRANQDFVNSNTRGSVSIPYKRLILKNLLPCQKIKY